MTIYYYYRCDLCKKPFFIEDMYSDHCDGFPWERSPSDPEQLRSVHMSQLEFCYFQHERLWQVVSLWLLFELFAKPARLRFSLKHLKDVSLYRIYRKESLINQQAHKTFNSKWKTLEGFSVSGFQIWSFEIIVSISLFTSSSAKPVSAPIMPAAQLSHILNPTSMHRCVGGWAGDQVKLWIPFD